MERTRAARSDAMGDRGAEGAGGEAERGEADAEEPEDEDGEDDASRLSDLAPGHNRVTWDLRHEDAEEFEGMILWGGGVDGPRVAPGTYTVRLTVDGETQTRPAELRQDPRSSATVEELREQERFLVEIRDKLTEVHVGDTTDPGRPGAGRGARGEARRRRRGGGRARRRRRLHRNGGRDREGALPRPRTALGRIRSTSRSD